MSIFNVAITQTKERLCATTMKGLRILLLNLMQKQFMRLISIKDDLEQKALRKFMEKKV